MKMEDAIVVWTPDHEWNEGAPLLGDAHVVGKNTNWNRTCGDYWMPATSLGEWGEVPVVGDLTKQLLGVFILFNTLVVRDNISPGVAHKAFLAIDEYRKAISPDSPGAD